jgi:hypothetical protein
MICAGGIIGAIGGCGISKGGIAGGTEAMGRMRVLAGMFVSFSRADRRGLKPAGGQDAMDKAPPPVDASPQLCPRDDDAE